jgi:hypothetical protein
MDSRIQAAIIGVFSALFGVILGGIIQSYLKEKEIKRHKMVAEGAVALYLCQLRSLFLNFSIKDETYSSLSLGITANENNIIEVEKIISLIEKHDPFLIVKLYNIKQLLHNIKSGSHSYWEQIEKDPNPKVYEPIVGNINVDGKNGVEIVDECIKHSFANSELQTKRYLLKNKDFNGFLQSILGENNYKKLKEKLKI